VLNSLAADTFDSIATVIESRGKKMSVQESKDLARAINIFNGHGDFYGLENNVVPQNLFFSAKYWASRVQILAGTPIWKARKSPRVMKKIIGMYVRSLTPIAMLIGYAAMNGWTDPDPRSSDFGVVKVGSRTFDMTGGLKTHIVFISRLIAAMMGSEDVIKKSDGSFSKRNDYVLESYSRSRLAPVPGVVVGLARRDSKTGLPTNAIRQPQTPTDTARSLSMPITFNEVWKNIEDGEDLKMTALGAVANIFGIGSSYRNPDEKMDTKALNADDKKSKSEKSSDGSISPEDQLKAWGITP